MEKVVLKFGGSVIPDVQAINKVAGVVQRLSVKYDVLAVVVSAMGKTTNKLDAMAQEVRPDWKENYLAGPEGAAILVTGELQTAPLLALRLLDSVNGKFAQSYNAFQAGICTNDDYHNAKIIRIGNKVPKAVSSGILPIIAGYQGRTKNGAFTTLGREGSDFTAVEFALKLKADFCMFFKDKGGIYDKNPECPDAQVLDFVPYDTMLNFIDSRPQQVLYRKCVERAQNKKLPLCVVGIDDLEHMSWVASPQWWNDRNKHR